MGETPMKRNMNDISEVELNFMGFRGIGESIERLLRCSFEIFDDASDLVNRCLVDHTARSINEQTYIFVKLNVWRQFHRTPGLSHNAAPPTSNFRH
jgi:hypothetical protein